MTRSLVFLALAACGGGAFALETPDGGQETVTATPEPASAPDAGPDSVPDGVVTRDSWHETAQLAQDGSTSAQDGAGGTDAAQGGTDGATPDAKPANTCTPFPLPLLQFGSCTGPIDQPTYFVTTGPKGCENRVTPIVCTCQETYNCDCILKQAPDICGGARFVQSCGYATGPGGPTSGILIRCMG